MPSYSEIVGQYMNLQNAMQMRQLRNAEIENQTLEAQGRRMTLGDQQAQNDAIRANTSVPGQPQPQQPAPETSTNMMGAVAPPGAAPLPAPATGSNATPMTQAPPSDEGDFSLTHGFTPDRVPAPAPPNPAVAQAGTPQAAQAAAEAQNVIGNVNGTPIVNHAAVLQTMRQSGHGVAADKLEKEWATNDSAMLDTRIKQLTIAGANNNQTAAAFSNFQTVLASPNPKPADIQAAWQQSRNQALQIPGDGPNGKLFSENDLPVQYTDSAPEGSKFKGAPQDFAPALVNNNESAQKAIEQHTQALNATNQLVQGNIKTALDRAHYGNVIVDTASSPQDVQEHMLAAQRQGWSMRDIADNFPVMRDATGQPVDANGQPATKAEQLVAQLTPDIQARAHTALMTARQADQSSTGQQNADTRSQNADTAARRADDAAARQGSSSAAQKQAVMSQANRVFTDSMKGGGTSIDDAIRNAQTYYQDDPDINANRGAIVAQLNAWKAQNMKPAQIQAQMDKSDTLSQFKKIAGGGATASPAAPATPPRATAATPQSPAPAAQPKPGATRTLTQADVDQATARGKSGFRAGQVVTYGGPGKGWQ